VVRDDGPGGQRLVAYFVAGGPEDDHAGELAAFLRERLPEYMVPSAFVRLKALPLNSSGKVDRGALPAPEALSDLARTFVAPRTDEERIVAAIWRDVLERERVGVNDNFFDLGGHSLLIVRVNGRLRESFPDRPLSVVELFRHPTVASLAARLSGLPEPGRAELETVEGQTERRQAGRERLGRRRSARTAHVAGEEADA
jgi:hypothetical protein